MAMSALPQLPPAATMKMLESSFDQGSGGDNGRNHLASQVLFDALSLDGACLARRDAAAAASKHLSRRHCRREGLPCNRSKKQGYSKDGTSTLALQHVTTRGIGTIRGSSNVASAQCKENLVPPCTVSAKCKEVLVPLQQDWHQHLPPMGPSFWGAVTTPVQRAHPGFMVALTTDTDEVASLA